MHGVPQELNTRWRSKKLPNRVTLLVNVWQSRKPKGILSLPNSITLQLRPARKAQPNFTNTRSDAADFGGRIADAKSSCAPCLVLEVPQSSADNATTLTVLDEHVEGFTAGLPTRDLWHIEACPLSAEFTDENSIEHPPSSCHIIYDK